MVKYTVELQSVCVEKQRKAKTTFCKMSDSVADFLRQVKRVKKADLIMRCSEKGLSTKGNKSQLFARLNNINVDSDASTSDEEVGTETVVGDKTDNANVGATGNRSVNNNRRNSNASQAIFQVPVEQNVVEWNVNDNTVAGTPMLTFKDFQETLESFTGDGTQNFCD